MDADRIAMQLRDRLRNIDHAVRLSKELGGMIPVPVASAARFLGVTPSRVHSLIRDGRLRVVYILPTEHPRDRMIPLDDLIALGGVYDQGRRMVYGRQRARFVRRNVDNRGKKGTGK